MNRHLSDGGIDEVPSSFNREFLVDEGFVGFQSVGHLRTSGLADVPRAAGIYAILREPGHAAPVFLDRSLGGHFKGRDPSVALHELNENWVQEAEVLYIGKAGGAGHAATLRARLSRYLEFGSGKPVGHWGGRFIWQLAHSGALSVCWRVLESDEPRQVEKQMLGHFRARYGRLPFANLRV